MTPPLRTHASSAERNPAWSAATAVVVAWNAIGLGLAVARTFAEGAPRPVPHRVTAALAAQAAALVAAALVLRTAARRGTDGRGTGAWPTLFASIAAALVGATLVDVLGSPPLLGGLLAVHRRALLDAVFGSTLALAFAGLRLRAAGGPLSEHAQVDPRALTRAAKGRPIARPRSLATTALRATALATLVLVACEAAVSALAVLRPSPLLAGGAEASDQVRAHLLEPGSSRFGFPVNREGFYDDEPAVAGGDDLLVAVLGDSFVVGVVPRDRGFVEVAERLVETGMGGRRGQVTLQNWGVAGAGLREEEWLLHARVLATRPTTVVLALFVGNDVLEVEDPETLPVTHASLRHWLLWQVPRRLAIAAASGRSADPASGAAAVVPAPPPGASPGVPDFVADPSLEKPTFGEAEFLDVERRRADVLDPSNATMRRRFDVALAAVERLHEALGKRLLVLVLPDQVQVDDALWEQVRGARSDGARLDRDLPQREIARFCAERSIDCVDVLAAMRAAERGGRTYHLRDTHPNARGNEVIGRELARSLLGRLGPRT
ncbi:MAG: hypothetical protein ACKO2K_20020 [Alphaproteobacteria bacterium]